MRGAKRSDTEAAERERWKILHRFAQVFPTAALRDVIMQTRHELLLYYVGEISNKQNGN